MKTAPIRPHKAGLRADLERILPALKDVHLLTLTCKSIQDIVVDGLRIVNQKYCDHVVEFGSQPDYRAGEQVIFVKIKHKGEAKARLEHRRSHGWKFVEEVPWQ